MAKAKKKSGFMGARRANSLPLSERIKEAPINAVIRSGVDMKKLKKLGVPTWEIVRELKGYVTDLLFQIVKPITDKDIAPRFDAAAKLANDEIRNAILYRLGQLQRDITIWETVIDDAFRNADGKTGPVEAEHFQWFVELGAHTTKLIQGIENSITPIMNEIETTITVMNYNMLGVTPAEFEALSDESRQKLACVTYVRKVLAWNKANPNDPIDMHLGVIGMKQKGLLEDAEIDKAEIEVLAEQDEVATLIGG